MASAFVLLKVENREVVEVHGEVEALPEVTEAHVISGVYEVFTMVHTDTMPAIEALVHEQIERIKGVSSTLTLIILEPEPEEAPDDIPPPEVRSVLHYFYSERVHLAEFALLHVEFVEEPGIERDEETELEINRGPPCRSDPRTHWIRKQLLIQ